MLLRLVDAQGTEIWRQEGWPWGAPTSQWPVREVRPDGHTVTPPAGTPPGLYKLLLTFYDPATLDTLPATSLAGAPLGDTPPVAMLQVGASPAAAGKRWEFGDCARARRHRTRCSGTARATPLRINFNWESLTRTPTPYTLFSHVVGPDGSLVAQADSPPLGGFAPTNLLLPGQRFADGLDVIHPGRRACRRVHRANGALRPGNGRAPPPKRRRANRRHGASRRVHPAMSSGSLAHPRRRWALAATFAGLTLLLALAAWLRWDALRNLSLYVDEFTTLWAARQVQAHGIPLMPSGVLYTRGLLASYIQAATAGFFGDSYITGRMPSLVFGLLTILAVWQVGRRGWRCRVGWLAALGLALLPEAILWSARARFYAQVQFFALLALWAAWETIRERLPAQAGHVATPGADGKWGKPLLFALAFVLALYSQEQALLLYPSILLAMLIWLGWRRLLAPPLLAAQAICLAAMGARFAIEIWGQPNYFETIQATRPYVGLILDVAGAWNTYAAQLIAPDRLPWTLAGLIALGTALVVAVRARSVRRISLFHQSSLYYGLQMLFVLGVLFLFVGTSWRDPRYLFLVQPLGLLLGAAGILWLVEQLPGRAQTPAFVAAALAMVLLMTQPALAVTTQQVEGYDRVLETVRSLRAPGDAVLSPQPPACALVLDSCDGYAIEKGYAEYVIRRADGLLVDRWTGSPLIDSAAALEEVVRSHARTWFVADAFRLATRYDAATLKSLLTQFTVVNQEQGVVALRADGWRETPPLWVTQELSPTLRFGPLELVGWSHNEDFGPDKPLTIQLEWVGAEPIDAQINTSVRIVNAAGGIIAQDDGPPANGIIPTTLFFDTPLVDTKVLTLPVSLPNERYRIDVAAYTAVDGAPLPDAPNPQPLDWFAYFTTHGPLIPGDLGGWENGLRLLDATPIPESLAGGDVLSLHLMWSAAAPTAEPLTAFVQLIGPDGAPVAQDDHQPEGGFYPTTGWHAGEPTSDTFTLNLPDALPPGPYTLVTGWYDAAGVRVPVEGGGDVLKLGEWVEEDN